MSTYLAQGVGTLGEPDSSEDFLSKIYQNNQIYKSRYRIRNLWFTL